MEKEKICKICGQPFTEKDFDDLHRRLNGDKTVEAKHFRCYMEGMFNRYGVGIK